MGNIETLFLCQTTSKPGEKGVLVLYMLSLYCTLFTMIYSIWTQPIVHQVRIIIHSPLLSSPCPHSSCMVSWWCSSCSRLLTYSNRTWTWSALSFSQLDCSCMEEAFYSGILVIISIVFYTRIISQGFKYLYQKFTVSAENHFCHLVQSARSSSPSLLKPLTQLHGWWHLMAGMNTDHILYTVFIPVPCQVMPPTSTCSSAFITDSGVSREILGMGWTGLVWLSSIKMAKWTS